jgi:molecular chaperone HtpG
MRFVKGVVDCADLPLNVSREMLQENALLVKIKKNLVRKVMSTLEKMKNNDKEKYQNFFNEFSLYIKEGVGTDFENRDKLIELLRYRTNKTEGEETISLAEYVDRMPESQKEIYYLTGDNFDELKNSPYLEVFNDRGQEVILMTEPVDEWLSSTLTEYKEKKFKAAHKGEIEADEKEKKKQEEQKETFASFLEFAKEQLEGVKEVRLSTRLKNSASCLVVEDGAASANMERIMKQIGQNEMFPNSMRILELNPENKAVASVQALYEKDPKDSRLPGFIKLFHDQALLAEGSQITDASGFAQRVNSLMEAL